MKNKKAKLAKIDPIQQDLIGDQLISLRSRLALWLDSVRAVPCNTAISYQSQDLVENLGDLLEQITDLEDDFQHYYLHAVIADFSQS